MNLVTFFYICIIMEEKKYKTYLLFFFDEEIEEENTCGQTLSLKSAKEQEEYGIWIGSVLSMTKNKILKNVWDKDDVDSFVEEYPEASEWTFKIDDEYEMRFRGYIEYKPISQNRDYKISTLLGLIAK